MNIKSVFFNHLYTILDEATYNEIKKSDFLKNKFCHCEEKTHHGAKSMSWTGFYMTGENTYLELFCNKDKECLENIKIGNIGIAFSVDQEEEFEEITKAFKQKYTTNIHHGIFEKDINHNLIKWFYFIETTNDASMMPYLDSWVMTYHKDYFKKLNQNSITRQEYNKTFNAVPFDKNKLFKDVEEITLLLNNEIKTKFMEKLTLLGYSCQANDNETTCSNSTTIFKLKLSKDQKNKLLKLQMSLNYKINDFQTYTLGNSTLTLENQTATWIFK